jgi:hypothetical protein
VRADSKVQITFNEAMDPATVTAALSISTLGSNAWTSAWSSGNTVLTITPSSPWQYASGAPTVSPRSYTVSLSGTAADVAGNTLVPTSFRFSTMRQIQQVLSPAAVVLQHTAAAEEGLEPEQCNNSSELFVGRWEQSGSNTAAFIYVDFDASEVAEQAVEIQSATFNAVQIAPAGSFYPNGSVWLDLLEDGDLDRDVISLDVQVAIGTLASDGDAGQALDCTQGVIADLESSEPQLLFAMSAANAAINQYAYFECGQFTLDIRYLAP